MTLELLSVAPNVVEFEGGVLTLCGTANLESVDGKDINKAIDISQPFQNFPVFVEIAWNSKKDWTNSIA